MNEWTNGWNLSLLTTGQYRTDDKAVGLETDILGFEFWLHHFLGIVAYPLWASGFFPEMEIVIAS